MENFIPNKKKHTTPRSVLKPPLSPSPPPPPSPPSSPSSPPAIISSVPPRPSRRIKFEPIKQTKNKDKQKKVKIFSQISNKNEYVEITLQNSKNNNKTFTRNQIIANTKKPNSNFESIIFGESGMLKGMYSKKNNFSMNNKTQKNIKNKKTKRRNNPFARKSRNTTIINRNKRNKNGGSLKKNKRKYKK